MRRRHSNRARVPPAGGGVSRIVFEAVRLRRSSSPRRMVKPSRCAMEVAMEPIPSERSLRAFGGWTVTRTNSIRVGDRERDAAAAALAQHYAQGRLTAAEHDER